MGALAYYGNYILMKFISASSQVQEIQPLAVDKLTIFFFLKHPLPILLVLGLLLCLVIALIVIFDNLKLGILNVLLLLMGFCSKVAMGFSPTVFASGVRTYYLTYIVIILIVLSLLNELSKISVKKYEVIQYVLLTIGICTFFLTLFNR